MSVRIEAGDCLEVIPCLVAEGVVCDAIVTDPPYHLTAIAERSKYPAKYGKDGAMQRLLGGFMNQTWDGGDIAFRPETWAVVATILRPGAFLVAFGGTRTSHRLACAIEDAGFVIQDCLMWLFATGFPKRRDMLKPAFEPIVLAYKPGGKRTMQIDECRIETDGRPLLELDAKETVANVYTGRVNGDATFSGGSKAVGSTDLGRWPANVCHDGSDEVLACFPQRGPSSAAPRHNGDFKSASKGAETAHTTFGHDDGGGSAARFFFSAKAGAQDRWGSRHPTVKPVDLIAWLVALVTPPGGTFLDPFAGSGTAAVAALKTGRNAILIEREDAYVADIRERLAHYEGNGRHSLASKARQAKPRGEMPLFDEPFDETADAINSYTDAIQAIGERVKAGAAIPDFFLSGKDTATSRP